MAKFNAALNGIGNVEAPHGKLLRTGGRGGEIAQAILAALPGRLEPQGRAMIFSSWPEDAWPIHVPRMTPSS